MNRRIFPIILSLLLFALGAKAHDFLIEESDFRLIDSKNQAQLLSYYSDQALVVLLAWPENCSNRAEILHWFVEL